MSETVLEFKVEVSSGNGVDDLSVSTKWEELMNHYPKHKSITSRLQSDGNVVIKIVLK